MMSVAGVLRGYLRARNCNLFSCDDFQQLCNIHGQISKQKHTINNDINIPSKTFDNFLHLIEHHHNPQEIKIILDKLKTNNIDPCKTYKWKGPDRKVFGTKILTLYHVTDEKSAESIFKQNKMKCGSKGMFGGGIYFAETPKNAHYKALRTGVLITAKVFVGNEYNAKDGSAGSFDFKSLQQLKFDSVYAPNGSGSGAAERVVYNSDQVYLIKKETYKPPPTLFSNMNINVVPSQERVFNAFRNVTETMEAMVVWSMFSMAICISLIIIGVCTMLDFGYNAFRVRNKGSKLAAYISMAKTTSKGSCSKRKELLDRFGTINKKKIYDVPIADSEFELNWKWLKDNYPEIYIERKQLVEDRIQQKMHKVDGDIVNIPGNGNCLINAYLYHIENMTPQNALKERTKLIKFIKRHKLEYGLIVDDIDKHINMYSKNYIHLDEVHIKALHEMNKINILVFEYHINTDSLSTNYYYKKKK
eukprot:455484_1